MAFLIDTNILLRTMQPHHPHCAPAERAVATLRSRNETLHVAAQNLIEFWAAATRPEGENGLGISMEAATRGHFGGAFRGQATKLPNIASRAFRGFVACPRNSPETPSCFGDLRGARAEWLVRLSGHPL